MSWLEVLGVFIGSFIGFSLGDMLSQWLKKKLGWIE